MKESKEWRMKLRTIKRIATYMSAFEDWGGGEHKDEKFVEIEEGKSNGQH